MLQLNSDSVRVRIFAKISDPEPSVISPGCDTMTFLTDSSQWLSFLDHPDHNRSVQHIFALIAHRVRNWKQDVKYSGTSLRGAA